MHTSRVLSLVALINHAVPFGSASTTSAFADQPIETKIRDKVPCSVCAARTSFDPESTEDVATFRFHYNHDGQDLHADVVLLLLVGDEYRTVVIEDAILFDQTTNTFEIVAGDDWSWQEVDYVWVDLIPRA